MKAGCCNTLKTMTASTPRLAERRKIKQLAVELPLPPKKEHKAKPRNFKKLGVKLRGASTADQHVPKLQRDTARVGPGGRIYHVKPDKNGSRSRWITRQHRGSVDSSELMASLSRCSLNDRDLPGEDAQHSPSPAS